MIFIDNKYTKHYMLLIEKAKNRTLPKDIYKESHHVIPSSLGGTDDNNNKVSLTGREHALCHWALLKMTEGEDYVKMSYAFNCMNAENEFQQRYHSRIITRAYERHRIIHAKTHSARMKGCTPWNKGGVEITDAHRENLRKAALRRPPKSEATIQKWKESRDGYKHSEETKLKQSISQTGKVKGPQTEAHRNAISLASTGIKKCEGHSDKVRQANIGIISINKDDTEKKVKRDTLNQWLSEGWSLGGRKRKVYEAKKA